MFLSKRSFIIKIELFYGLDRKYEALKRQKIRLFFFSFQKMIAIIIYDCFNWLLIVLSRNCNDYHKIIA